MISKEQAENISNELLDQARSGQVNTPSGGWRSTWLFDVPGLRPLTRAQRWRILRQGVLLAQHQWQVQVVVFVWLSFILAIAFELLPGIAPQKYIMFATIFGAIPVALIQRHYVRRKVEELIASPTPSA